MLQRLGFGEIMLILFIVLLVFGVKKLPALGKGLGEGISEFKKAAKELSKKSANELP